MSETALANQRVQQSLKSNIPPPSVPNNTQDPAKPSHLAQNEAINCQSALEGFESLREQLSWVKANKTGGAYSQRNSAYGRLAHFRERAGDMAHMKDMFEKNYSNLLAYVKDKENDFAEKIKIKDAQYLEL
ncbi:hypothetical protein B9Z19DRAFT_1126904 [Tuber borchii]|uniref:Uncharacterized protein n=1 Tax=Tuber borchii TaxID=42251 RepID=A0A2T6ZS60_TUBBO|nr:hypothetical protein B9Z19DRAFT_1126904 [Tuber borchii]